METALTKKSNPPRERKDLRLKIDLEAVDRLLFLNTCPKVVAYSTRDVAKRLDITQTTLSTYVKLGKVSMPKILQIGGRTVHSWDDSDAERLRELLPKIANLPLICTDDTDQALLGQA